MKRASMFALASLLVLASRVHAEADDERSLKHETKTNPLSVLVPYDLTGDRTLVALAAIEQEARKTGDGKKKRELTFVRTMALSDLWVIGYAHEDVGLLDRVAQALAVARGDVQPTLDRMLSAVGDEVVQDIVDDAREALHMTVPQRAGEAPRVPVGPRTRALFASRVAAALRASSPEETLHALSELAPDPCAARAPCDAVYQPFDQPGRRAAHALALGARSLGAMERDANDPFVAAVGFQIQRAAAGLSGAELAPNVRLSHGKERALSTDAGDARAPDIVILVQPERVQYAFVPRVRLDDNGKLALTTGPEPVLPATREVLLGTSFSPSVRSLEELVHALAPLRTENPNAHVAVAATPQTPAHIWARALLSAQAAGFSRLAMMGVGNENEMRLLDVEVVGPMRAADVGPRELNVVVRLGGFTVKRAGPTVTIPRVKREEGFTFDFDSLLSSAQPAQVKSAKLTFMSDVAAGTLAKTAFLVAPRAQALTVVLP